MAVFQLGPQTVKPTALGGLAQGMQAYQANKAAFDQRRLQQQLGQAQIQLRLAQAYKAMNDPLSVNDRVSEQMAQHEPGSPEWLALARITGGGTNISLTQNQPGAQKSTMGKIESDILDSRNSVLGLDVIEKLFKPEYTEIPFQAQVKTSRLVEKGGAISRGLGLKLPEEPGGLLLTSKQLGDYAGWEGQAEKAFLTFRKWATGVAGGKEEMAAIRQAFATKDKSASEFRGMIKQARVFQQAYEQSLTKLLQQGSVVNAETKAIAAKEAVDAAGLRTEKPTDAALKKPLRMISPSGKKYIIDASEVEKARKHGYQEIQ
jgi:hypothetical protein